MTGRAFALQVCLDCQRDFRSVFYSAWLRILHGEDDVVDMAAVENDTLPLTKTQLSAMMLLLEVCVLFFDAVGDKAGVVSVLGHSNTNNVCVLQRMQQDQFICWNAGDGRFVNSIFSSGFKQAVKLVDSFSFAACEKRVSTV